jgi:hypothetical protein
MVVYHTSNLGDYFVPNAYFILNPLTYIIKYANSLEFLQKEICLKLSYSNQQRFNQALHLIYMGCLLLMYD